MLAFRTRSGARFFYRADLSDIAYANISFFDRDRERILFHLSLRREEGRAVCNRRGVEPESWGRETGRRVALSRERATEVEIRFQPPEVSVWLDGRQVFRFGGLGRRRFPGLDGIAYADFQGGISAAGIDIDTSGLFSEDGLGLTDRMELRGWAVLPASQGGFRLEVAGVEHAPEVISWPADRGGAGPDAASGAARRMGLRVILPGRLWTSVPGDAPLELRLLSEDGTPCGGISISREELLRRVEAALTEFDLEGDAFAAMQVAEHVRFAGLEPALSGPARAAFSAMAAFYDIDDFLYEAQEPDSTPAPAGDGDAPLAGQPDGAGREDDAEALSPQTQLEICHAGLAARLAEDPQADLGDVLGTTAQGTPLPAAQRRSLYLLLAEPFCLSGRFPELFDLMQAEKLALPAPAGEIWHDSALMPFLWQAGQSEALADLFWTLVEQTEGWPVTPAIAWVVERVIEAEEMPEQHRDGLLYAFTAFLEKRAWDYWSRTPCLALTTAAARLVRSQARLADYATTDLIAAVLRVYGLSRAFWEALGSLPGSADVAQSMRLETARAAFDLLAGHAAGTAPAEAGALAGALALFRDLGVAGTDRLGRELLGPSGVVAAAQAPAPAQLLAAGQAPGEAAMRHLAYPGAPSGGPELAALAGEAMAECYHDVPRAPYRRLQIETARRIAAWLGQGGSAAMPGEDEIDALAADLNLLASRRSEFLGLGLGLMLADGLLSVDAAAAEAPIARLAGHLSRTLGAMSTEDRAAGRRATAPLMALQALRGRHGPQAAAPLTALFRDAALPGPVTAPAPFPASPLFDALVTVFSCRPNLDTRIAAMRESWLSRLDALGIPYVVIVGGGDDTLDGDVLHLDAPDDYEGLPQKTLATIRWVHDHTPYSHMIKVDDDCFVDPDTFFLDLAFRKFDYYGRSLTRSFGQMDRAWHCAKSVSLRGRNELDKSPEPSTYADGGSGYVLSRRAMAAATEAAASPEGRHLVQVSFMEDKLLGDLLALRGIVPMNEDYRISVRRRTHSGAMPVSLWVNGFDPSRAAPVKLVHLDTHLTQGTTLAGLGGDTLSPKKIWPSYMGVRLGFCSNALELVSPMPRLEAAREAEVAVVACQRNELFILPHFLDHYRRLGVGAFLIADNASDDGTLEYLAEQPDVALFSVDTDYSASHYGVAWQQALLASFRMNRWSVVADADEFLFWQTGPGARLADLLAGPEFEEAEAARVFMLDMYPKGPLEEADFATGDPFSQAGYVEREPFLQRWPGQGPFSDSPVWTSALRHRLIPQARPDLFVAQKYALLRYRPWMRLSAGLHFLTDIRLARSELFFAHFKYNANFHSKARDEVARRQHFNNAEEYRKYLALASEGRSVIHDPEISVPWDEAAFVRSRLRPAAGQAV